MPNASDPRFTSSQRTGLGTRRTDQDRTLEAVHDLEAALASAAPGREHHWRRGVSTALAVLDEAMSEEERNAHQPDSLLSDIARTQPRLRNRVRGLRAQYRQLRATVASLNHDLAVSDEASHDFGDTRQRLAWLLTALRHHHARESDLIYEAYFEAFNADIETDTPG
jgi:DNA repair ATPase RecN